MTDPVLSQEVLDLAKNLPYPAHEIMKWAGCGVFRDRADRDKNLAAFLQLPVNIRLQLAELSQRQDWEAESYWISHYEMDRLEMPAPCTRCGTPYVPVARVEEDAFCPSCIDEAMDESAEPWDDLTSLF